MQQSQIPAKFPVPFANGASSNYVRTIPQASQIGIIDGAASLTDGFPPKCFIPVGSGGTPPYGEEFNGIFKQITSWDQWFSIGGPIAWDGNQSAAIGGYPNGAVVKAVSGLGAYWLCTVDNNTSNPDAAGAGWIAFQLYFPSNPTPNIANTRISDATNAGLSLAVAGDQSLTINEETTINLQNVTVPPAIGTVSGGILTIAKAGFYFIQVAGALAIYSATADVGTFYMSYNRNRGGVITGTPDSAAYPIPAGGGQSFVNLNIGIVGELQVGDLVYISAKIGDQMGNGTNPIVSSYTNMTLIYLNG